MDIEILSQLADITYPREGPKGGCPSLLEASRCAIWSDFARILNKVPVPPEKTPELRDVLQQSREVDDARGYSALHYCILYNAPVRLVEKLIRLSNKDPDVRLFVRTLFLHVCTS